MGAPCAKFEKISQLFLQSFRLVRLTDREITLGVHLFLHTYHINKLSESQN